MPAALLLGHQFLTWLVRINAFDPDQSAIKKLGGAFAASGTLKVEAARSEDGCERPAYDIKVPAIPRGARFRKRPGFLDRAGGSRKPHILVLRPESPAQLRMSTTLEQPKLHRFQVMDTTSRDEMRDILVSHYGARDLSLRKVAEPFRGIANYFPAENLDLSYGAVSADLSVTFPGTDFVRQQFILRGGSKLSFGRSDSHAITPGKSGLVPPSTDFSCRFSQDAAQLFLRISLSALRGKLSALLGIPIGRSLQFAPGASIDSPEQLQLRRVLDFFIGELDRRDTTLSDFQRIEVEQLLVISFLQANPHNFSQLLACEKRPHAALWQVQTAEDYIEANWDRPITVEELAQQIGIAVRSLFYSFKKARGYTPMAFHQRIRLEHARRMLQLPDENTSVMAVSLKCGFQNPGHFARYYRESFGELPSMTLAVAQSRA
jgi:AraC-like DNA-binding protein